MWPDFHPNFTPMVKYMSELNLQIYTRNQIYVSIGTDLFCFGAPELHSDALHLLATGYKMVNKPQFIAIIKAHLEQRTKSFTDLSILDKIQRRD